MIRPKRSNDVCFGLFQSNDVRFRLFESNDVRFRLCSTLPDIVRFCSTLLDIVRLCSTLSGISRRVLIYNETRTSFDCFCPIIFQKPQPGQPQNVQENATKLIRVARIELLGLRFNQTDQKWLCFDRFV